MPGLSDPISAPVIGQMGSAAIQGGLGILGSGLSYYFNKKLAEQQNQYNLDMWKMQADYNSPQAQMQRFREAGLNPNLIYGQGSNGNMSAAPQMVTPQAPELSRQMQELGKAFNIENIRTMIANRKKAEADAENADTNARRNKYQLEAERHFGFEYDFDPVSGQFVRLPDDVISSNNLQGFRHTAYLKQMLANQYGRLSLIPYRQALLTGQANYLAPQIVMSNYEARHVPVSYWVGQGTKVLNSLTSIPSIFSPLKWVPRSHPNGSY